MLCLAKSRELRFEPETIVIPSYIHVRKMEVVSHILIIKDSLRLCCGFFVSKEFMSFV